MKPVFIAVEGMDGSGKTTTVNHIAKLLKNQGQSIKVVKAMGSGEIGHVIREKLLVDYFDQYTGSLACCLAILDAYKTAMKYLNEGHSVIMDRFIATYYAYNVWANKEPLAKDIFDLFLWNNDIIYREPDRYVFVNVDIQVAIDRMSSRGELTIIDKKPLDYHQDVSMGFSTFYNSIINDNITLIDNSHNEAYLNSQIETMVNLLI